MHMYNATETTKHNRPDMTCRPGNKAECAHISHGGITTHHRTGHGSVTHPEDRTGKSIVESIGQGRVSSKASGNTHWHDEREWARVSPTCGCSAESDCAARHQHTNASTITQSLGWAQVERHEAVCEAHVMNAALGGGMGKSPGCRLLSRCRFTPCIHDLL